MNSTNILEKKNFKKSFVKLHKETNHWLNELVFMQDEHVFLENLLSSHFLDLSKPKLYDPTRKLIIKLKEVEKLGDELADSIHIHNKHLATLIESLQFKGKRSLKKEHNFIKKDFEIYLLNFKYIKKKIFNLIKEIMKKNKKKLLIN